METRQKPPVRAHAPELGRVSKSLRSAQSKLKGRADALSSLTKEELAEKAAWYLEEENFYQFCVDVLDRDFEPQPHAEMCHVARKLISIFHNYFVNGYKTTAAEKRHFMALTPRGTFKSTVWNQCLGLWIALKYPNVRILIDSETVTKAMVFLGDIRSHVEENPYFRALYGDLENKSSWNNSNLLFANRTKTGLKEDTFMTCGVGTSMPGMHYDLIIGDDYVSDKNVNTFDLKEKVKNHIRQARSLLDPGAPHFILGTFWAFDDAYQSILGDEEQRKRYFVYVRSCGGIHDLDDDGVPRPLYFPTRLDDEELGILLSDQKPFLFSCQYRMNPIPEGDQVFDVKCYKVISKTHFLALLQGTPYYWYFIVDPAITKEQRRRGDYTAISPYVILPDGRRFLYRAKAVREGVDTLIDTIYNHYVSVAKDLGPSKNGQAHIEAIAFQQLFIPLLKQKEEQIGVRIKWQELDAMGNTPKEIRISAAVPYLEAGDLWLVEDQEVPSIHQLTGANKILFQQASEFPEATNDDMLDNQGYMIHIVKKPKSTDKVEKPQSWDSRMGHTKEYSFQEQLLILKAKDAGKDYKPDEEILHWAEELEDQWHSQ